MEQNVIQINGGITINVDVSVRIVINVKKYVCKPSTSIMDKIICDEIIDVKEMNFNKKYSLLYFTYLFINHHDIIDSC